MALNALPQYKRLYEDLRKQIVDGIYKEGDLLPSENELCALYGVTRPTVRQSLTALVSDGFIRKHQGKGSIVYKLPKGIGILSIAGTTSALGEKNISSEILQKPAVTQWPDQFMFPLSEAELRAGCIQLERIRYFNEAPIFYDINYSSMNIKFIIPGDFELDKEDITLLCAIEDHYNHCLKNGRTPQQARYFLPNGLKTELIMTANLREWRHFFKLRTAQAAHPQMREVAISLLKKFQGTIPIIFDDIQKRQKLTLETN